MSSPTKRDLQDMLRDVDADLRDLRRREVELEALVEWIKERLLEYPVLARDGRIRRSVAVATIRDYCRGAERRVTAQLLAEHFSISIGQARAKLDKLWEQGTLVKIKPDVGPAEYEFDKPLPTRLPGDRSVSLVQPEDEPLKLVGSGPVPKTGKAHPSVKRRRAQGQGTRARRGLS